jgi:hypothetical protein
VDLLRVLSSLIAAIDGALGDEPMSHPDRELRARLASARGRLAEGR